MWPTVSAYMVKINDLTRGWENLDNFVLHLNSIHTNIQFTMEVEGLEQIATFPSVKRSRGSLRQEAHTHTPICLIASTLVHRAKVICNYKS
jgi:hypothetical protein